MLLRCAGIVVDDEAPKSLRQLARGFRKRTLTTAKLATKVGLKAMKRQLAGAGAEPGAPQPDEDLSSAHKLVDELGALKGLMMKFGQIASYMPGAMSPKAQRVLAKLQAHTTAMEWDTVAEVLASELGRTPDDAFESLSHEPFAAASIGQVHRATLDGKAVAVKIQYPGIEEVLAEDLRSAKVMARVSTLGMAIDGKSLVAEMRARILEECDYELEARSQEAFRTLFDPLPGASVPATVASHSTRRVLTSVLDPGAGFQSFIGDAPQAAKDRAGAIIFSTCFRCIFSHCIYNADPHPGNYLLSPDGDVTFLDFGCVRHFDPTMIDWWRRVAKATLAGDKAGFIRDYPQLGFVPKPDKFDWDHQWNMMQYLYRPFLTDGPFTYTDSYVRESYGLMIFDNPNRFRTAMPPEWVFLNRLQWGLNSILAALGSTARFCDLYREALDLPSDPLRIEGHPGLLAP
ncbi:MAG: AarF/ABC1/UbiB kinase family protein [Myxococcota bacterium]